jgi:hypothetical protein
MLPAQLMRDWHSRRGIDAAQSLCANEYAPFDDDLIRLLNLHGRISQDVRLVLQDQMTFWWGKHYQIVPFAYVPGGNEAAGERESGGGTLAEVDILGNQKTIVGTTFLRGHATNGDRRLAGVYTRLGFGRWGHPGGA